MVNKKFCKAEDDEELVVELPEGVDADLKLPDPELLKYYEDCNNRIIWILGSIDEASCWAWTRRIFDYNREDKDIPKEQRKPIKLIFDNVGGSLPAAKMMSELISMSATPVEGICICECLSAATLIYLSCHKKYATKNSSFLFHHGSLSNLSGTQDEVSKFVDVYNKDIEELDKFYAGHTQYPINKVKKQLKEGDWYISFEEAIKHGVVDEEVKNLDIFM